MIEDDDLYDDYIFDLAKMAQMAWLRSVAIGGNKGGGASVPVAPVLTWVSDSSDPTLEFTIDLTNPQVGDVVTLELATNAGFTAGLQTYTDTLDSTEVAALTINFEIASQANGTYYARSKHSRGSAGSAWSNTVTGTISVEETETTALVARMSVAPDSTRRNHINNLIQSLKLSGVWSKLELFYVMAAHDAQAAQLNWVANANNLVPNSSPTFTTDRGYAGNGTSAYLATGLNHSLATKALQNSQFFALGNRTNLTESSTQYAVGVDNFGATIACLFSADAQVQMRIGVTASATLTNDANPAGRYLANRTASNNTDFYKNGASLGSIATASSASVNANITLLRTSSSYGTAELSFFALGGPFLTSGEIAAFESAITTYLTAVGA